MNHNRAWYRIIVFFDEHDGIERALGSLRTAGVEDYEAYGPTNLDDLQHLMPKRGSLVRGIAVIGAVSGLLLFFYMCIATSLIYNIIVGAKYPVANTPYIVPAYEGTILLGAIAAFIAALIFARLFFRQPSPGYDNRFASDCYGIVIHCPQERKEAIIQLLKNAGGVEINESRD